MPGRRKKFRQCRNLEGGRHFKPCGVPACSLEVVQLELDELEALRLCDYEGKSQIEASQSMIVSRATVQRLLDSGRKKILDVLLFSKQLRIPEALPPDASGLED